MMKLKTVGILAIGLSIASTGAMARGTTAIDMVMFSGALIEHGYAGPPLVPVVPAKEIGKAPILQFNSKVSDQRKPSNPTIPTPVSGTGNAGQGGSAPRPSPTPAPSPSQPHVTNAPEMDAASMGGALTLLIGAVAVLRGRRKQALGMVRA
jgi:hypothetical protein